MFRVNRVATNRRPSLMGRPPTHHQATKDRLLDVATEVVVERGAQNLQIADVAAEVGLTAPAVYRYFRDRDELLVAALRRQVAGFTDEVTRASQRGGTQRDQMAGFLDDQRAYLESTDPGAVRFVLECVLAAADDPDLAAEVAPAVEALRWLHDPADSESDVRAQLVTAVCAGLQLLFAAGLLRVAPEEIYELVLGALEGSDEEN
jgi:AcrR family transcriptional regulator